MMGKTARAREWFQRVTLRGIEGIIADAYLQDVSVGNDVSVLDDYFNAKYMAEQVYAQCCGWGMQVGRVGAGR